MSHLLLDSGAGMCLEEAARAVKAALLEGQQAREDVWLHWEQSPEWTFPGGLFRAGLVCLVNVSRADESAPVNARFQMTAATVVCHEALRFVQVAWLRAESPRELLLELETAFDKYGFSTYLSPVEDAASQYATLADYLVRNNLLRKETEPWRALQIVRAVKQSSKPKKSGLSLVLDLASLPCRYCGTSEFPLSMLRAILRVRHTSSFSCVHVLVAPRAARFFDIAGLCERAEPNRVYDVLFRPSKLGNPLHLASALKIAVTHVVTHFDAITTRCAYINHPGQRLFEEILLAACDGVVFLSEYAQADMANIMGTANLPNLRHVLFAEPQQVSKTRRQARRNAGPVVVIGNAKHPHKYLLETLAAIREAQKLEPLLRKTRFVFLGELPGSELPPNVASFANNLSSAEFDNLLKSCAGVIYPSVYEGLGLPFLHALNHGKPVLAADYEHNRNVQRVFPDLALSFYGSLQELPAKVVAFVKASDAAQPFQHAVDEAWDRAAIGLLQFLERCAENRCAADSAQMQALQSLFLYQGMLSQLNHMSGMSFEELILKAKGSALFGARDS